MNPPFSRAEFLEVFARYNESVWPAQAALLVAAVVGIAAVVLRWPQRDRLATLILGMLWVWSGLAYHIRFFSAINPLASAFGVMFVVEGFAIMHYGSSRRTLVFAPRWGTPRAIAGAATLIYAVVAYPLIGMLLGLPWVETPTFGAPCPVVLYTFGLFLCSAPPFPKRLLGVPIIWALIATTAAVQFRIYQDWALIAVAAFSAATLLRREPGVLAPSGPDARRGA